MKLPGDSNTSRDVVKSDHIQVQVQVQVRDFLRRIERSFKTGRYAPTLVGLKRANRRIWYSISYIMLTINEMASMGEENASSIQSSNRPSLSQPTPIATLAFNLPDIPANSEPLEVLRVAYHLIQDAMKLSRIS